PAQRSALFPYTTLFRSSLRWTTPTWIRRAAVIARVKSRVNRPAASPKGVAFTASSASSNDVNGMIDSTGAKISSHITRIERCTRSEEHTSELQSRENLV